MDLNEISVASPSSVGCMSQEIDMRNLQIIEEGPSISQDTDNNMRNMQIIEEGPSICPLCSQELKLYFINYTEKLQMCENIQCEYPFGHTPLKMVREENGVQIVEMKSLRSKRTVYSTGSTFSQGSDGWSDVDKICNVFESEYVPSDGLPKSEIVNHQKKTDEIQRRKELQRNVEKIKEMTKSMSDMQERTPGIIRNEKWIKNLSYLSGLSGINLLRPEEMKKMKKKRVINPGTGELKIDIDKSNFSSIKIQIGPNMKKA